MTSGVDSQEEKRTPEAQGPASGANHRHRRGSRPSHRHHHPNCGPRRPNLLLLLPNYDRRHPNRRHYHPSHRCRRPNYANPNCCRRRC